MLAESQSRGANTIGSSLTDLSRSTTFGNAEKDTEQSRVYSIVGIVGNHTDDASLEYLICSRVGVRKKVSFYGA